MDKCRIARVAVEQTVYHIDKPYDYLIPENFVSGEMTAKRVIVPFGNGSATRIGIITEITDCCDYPKDKLKSVIAVLDEQPVLSKEMQKLAVFLKNTTFCTYFDAVRCLLPAGISFKTTVSYALSDIDFETLLPEERAVCEILKTAGEFTQRDKILKKAGLDPENTLLEKMFKKGILLRNDTAKKKMRTFSVKSARLANNLNLSQKFTDKQKSVVKYLQDHGLSAVKEVCYFTGVTTAVVNALAKKGVILLEDVPDYRKNSLSVESERDEITLNEEQNAAYNGLLQKYKEGYSTNLLYGVTGSGKTRVFLKMADEVVSQNKGVIVMVPEIALTPQTISVFNKRYGDKVAVIHSAMSQGSRMDEWRRIKDGKALVAIGTRSAVFAPFENLGLIIIDEEQEHTYKSEQNPKFHARDVAKFRAKYNDCMLILASATPSIESYSNALLNNYNLWRLNSRYGNAALPQVTTVDMRSESANGRNSQISSVLASALEDTMQKGEQAILLMNRRGYNTFVSCPDCGEVITCPNCSISMNYHAANHRLMCHYCGFSLPYAAKCPKCGGEHLKYLGTGTQKIEAELSAIFPKARILRMDADSIVNKNSYNTNLGDFAAHKYDIMLGTQMVAKGLDFENVTLVGVLNADKSLYSADFRCYEKTFSLLTQVVGRAGRGKKGGKAIIQTLSPEHNIIKLAARQDYETFYNQEILSRKLMIYPPYCDIALVVVQSSLRSETQKGINYLFEMIKSKIAQNYGDVKINILGPAIAAVPRINDKYRYRMIIKYRSFKRFSQLLNECLLEYNKSNFGQKAPAFADINPESII